MNDNEIIMNDTEINMSDIGINMSDIKLNNENDKESNKNIESVFNSNHLSEIVFQDLSKQIDSVLDENKTHKKCDNIIYYSLIILSFSYIVSICCWLAFSILVLCNTTNKEIQDKCSDSNLWNLLLILVLYTTINIISSLQKNNDESDNYKNIIIKLIMGTCFIIWCGIELFKKCPVNNLKNTTIYVLIEIYFWTCITMISILFISNGIMYYIKNKYK